MHVVADVHAVHDDGQVVQEGADPPAEYVPEEQGVHELEPLL